MNRMCRRCDLCGIDWPCTSPDYLKCPACGEDTHQITGNCNPLDFQEARSMKRRYEFERFAQKGEYERWAEDDERWGGRSPSQVLAMCDEIKALEQIPTLEERS